jgi:hypothetical protein
MAVSVTVTSSQYAGNGSSSTPYATGFAFQSSDWLRVYLTDAAGVNTLLTLGTHYTVTGAGNPAGGNVTTVAAYASTSKITIARVTPGTQLLDLEYADRLPSQLVEDALDKLTFALQELQNRKALTFPAAEPAGNDTELPAAAARANCVFGFDETGEAVIYRLPLPVVPLAPPSSGNFTLISVDGVIQWYTGDSGDYPSGDP